MTGTTTSACPSLTRKDEVSWSSIYSGQLITSAITSAKTGLLPVWSVLVSSVSDQGTGRSSYFNTNGKSAGRLKDISVRLPNGFTVLVLCACKYIIQGNKRRCIFLFQDSTVWNITICAASLLQSISLVQNSLFFVLPKPFGTKYWVLDCICCEVCCCNVFQRLWTGCVKTEKTLNLCNVESTAPSSSLSRFCHD